MTPPICYSAVRCVPPRLVPITLAVVLLASASTVRAQAADGPPAKLFPLAAVRLLEGPFARAVEANRRYLLELDPDRLLAPFLREAGLELRKPSYGNWESGGLDGHTAGHYLSALATMIASGNDPAGEFGRRLDLMLAELERCQKANGDGYIGGVPGSRALWKEIASGNVGAVRSKWVPWYNLHKTYAGLRDAWLVARREKARTLLVGLGDWCVKVTSGLSDGQMQQMLGTEYGGMNEVMADLHAITGNRKYLEVAQRFNHLELLEPLAKGQDCLTGKHANTQIPKIIGFERIASLGGDPRGHAAACFFWENVTRQRSVAFGGNSVAEHFNDPKDFRGMLEHREGPETCNTYNMLRLTEQLFAAGPQAAYVDFYERTLCNHLLSAINPQTPGYVYFTPIRPGHYRVYSQPDQCFWCCVGTGMENPGRYGQFVYAAGREGAVYVNLYLASMLKAADGVVIRQDTDFPLGESSRLTMKLAKPATFALFLRHPGWVAADAFAVAVNGQPVATRSQPSSYAEVRREWRDGDVVEVALPMRTTVERLPDGSDWAAILRGPIVLVAPSGTKDLVGLQADGARMGHVAHGPMVPLDQVPTILASADDLPVHVVPDTAAGPMRFRLTAEVDPMVPGGIALVPFFTLHDQRYQMYWQLTTREERAARQAKVVAAERARSALEAATLDAVAVGEQQPEVEHDFKGEGTKTGFHEGRRWRDGASFQYVLNSRGEKAADLVVTYWGGDAGRTFDILANDKVLATEELKNERPGVFFERRYPIPSEVLEAAADGRVIIKFVAKVWVAGGVFDVRLMKPAAPADKPPQP